LATTTAINFDVMCERYLRTQLGGDRRAALQFIDEALRGGASADDVRCRVVQAAQREIGRLWQEDRISIAQEHMATAISQLALAHLFQHAIFRARVGKKILVACVPGEMHDFPARLLADALDVAGYDVRFLGADVPLDALLRAIESEQPDLLALSVTMLFNIQSLRETVRTVRARSGHNVPIAIGGNAFTSSPELAEGLGAELVAADSDRFIAQLDLLFGARA
jgi:methanogenic corrinoid protein MtbC1